MADLPEKLKLEHRKEEILPFSRFISRLLNYGFFAALLIVFSVGMGTLGYHLLANLSWLDSFHMSCMILTGMGPVADMKTSGAKIFSSIYALYSGITFLSITAVVLAPVIHRLLHILHVEKENDV